nr:F-box/LRR-repeat protein 20-like [Lytechinus pictus]
MINQRLPKEDILRIFSYLDVVSLCRCAQVSKYWNLLALDGSNWQKVDLFNFQTDIEGPVVEHISKRCGGFLKNLSLHGCKSVTDDALNTFADNCRNIEVLNLEDCKRITDHTAQSLSRFSKKLSQLNMVSCTAITDNALKYLSDGCHVLSHLNISWCDQISDNGIEALVRGCSNIKVLILKGCHMVSSFSMKHYVDSW